MNDDVTHLPRGLCLVKPISFDYPLPDVSEHIYIKIDNKIIE